MSQVSNPTNLTTDTFLGTIPWSEELRTLAGRFGDQCAVRDESGQLSYAELCARAHALAHRLLARGLRAGEAVATLLPNGRDAVWASAGVTLAGAAETPLDWRVTTEEIDWSLRLARFRVVVTVRARVDALRELGLQTLVVDELDELDRGATLAPVPAGNPGRILFSSGTSGRPKGVVYTHGRRWLANQMLKASLPFVPEPRSRILMMTPFGHGASLLAFAWRDHGGEIVLFNGVDPERVRALLAEEALDAIFAPPTVLAKLSTAFGDAHFPLRCVFTGTAPMTPALYARTCALFGPVVRITYGKAECTNPITVLPPRETHAHFTAEPVAEGCCVGWAAPGVELRIRPPEDGAEPSLPDDPSAEVGEVWLRARHMSEGVLAADGYHPHPDGWHRTGDLGRLDTRGRLWLMGRLGDVMKTGGYRVNPDEIESCLAGLPACGPVCVTSLPSAYWGEVIVAVAEAASDQWVEEARARLSVLSRHKHPRAFVRVAALPRNERGKVNRRALGEWVLATYDFTDGPHPTLSSQKG